MSIEIKLMWVHWNLSFKFIKEMCERLISITLLFRRNQLYQLWFVFYQYLKKSEEPKL